jgi:translation initiation factor eIF-2B subunit beta
LTVGYSKTVEAFLKAAFKERNFTVIVAETAPSYVVLSQSSPPAHGPHTSRRLLGRTMAKALAKHGIPTIIVPDSNIYALMPRVTKVLLGAHVVLANGGFFTVSGALLAAMAARAHSTPVVVVAGQYKFAPAWNLHHDIAALDFGDPSDILGYEEGELLDKVEVANPFYDYVKPDLVNLFITNE